MNSWRRIQAYVLGQASYCFFVQSERPERRVVASRYGRQIFSSQYVCECATGLRLSLPLPLLSPIRSRRTPILTCRLGAGQRLKGSFAFLEQVKQDSEVETDVQVGKTVTRAPCYMRTQLWLGVLQRYPGLGNKSARQYNSLLRKVGFKI